MASPDFSFIVPSKGNPEGLDTFLQSIVSTATRPEAVEVILVIDEDDHETAAVPSHGLQVKKIAVPAGMPMGALNMTGYRQATADNIMLLNDDVILETPGWDDRIAEVLATYPDGIVLIHINEKIFGERLCTFPFVTRAYCEAAGGICPDVFLRYRIDDHVYNVFNLLSCLGHRRIVYLPDVVFRHMNFELGADGTAEYTPDPVIIEKDIEAFDAMMEERRNLALTLAETIEAPSGGIVRSERLARLARIPNAYVSRDHAFVRYVAHESDILPNRQGLACTLIGCAPSETEAGARMFAEYAPEAAVVQHTWSPKGKRGIGRILNQTAHDPVGDRVFVLVGEATPSPDLLERMVKRLGPGTGLVAAPLRKGAALLLDAAAFMPIRVDQNYGVRLAFADLLLQMAEKGFCPCCLDDAWAEFWTALPDMDVELSTSPGQRSAFLSRWSNAPSSCASYLACSGVEAWVEALPGEGR